MQTSPDQGKSVFEIPQAEDIQKIPGRHNVSLSFPAPDQAVLADGGGKLYILETGPRTTDNCKVWTVSHKYVSIPVHVNYFFLLLLMWEGLSTT